MKFKAGDKVWVLRTHHPGAPVPPGSVHAGVVVRVHHLRRLGQTYLVDIPSVPHPHSGNFTEWVVYEQRMRPRDEYDDGEPADRFGDATPNKKTHWGRCPWVPAEVRYNYTKHKVPL